MCPQQINPERVVQGCLWNREENLWSIKKEEKVKIWISDTEFSPPLSVPNCI